MMWLRKCTLFSHVCHIIAMFLFHIMGPDIFPKRCMLFKFQVAFFRIIFISMYVPGLVALIVIFEI